MKKIKLLPSKDIYIVATKQNIAKKTLILKMHTFSFKKIVTQIHTQSFLSVVRLVFEIKKYSRSGVINKVRHQFYQFDISLQITE